MSKRYAYYVEWDPDHSGKLVLLRTSWWVEAAGVFSVVRNRATLYETHEAAEAAMFTIRCRQGYGPGAPDGALRIRRKTRGKAVERRLERQQRSLEPM